MQPTDRVSSFASTTSQGSEIQSAAYPTPSAPGRFSTVKNAFRRIRDLTHEAKKLLWNRNTLININAGYNLGLAAAAITYAIYSAANGNMAPIGESLFDAAVHTYNFGVVAVPFLLSKHPSLKSFMQSRPGINIARGALVGNIIMNCLREGAILCRKMRNDTSLPLGLEAIDFFVNHPISVITAVMQIQDLSARRPMYEPI